VPLTSGVSGIPAGAPAGAIASEQQILIKAFASAHTR